MPKRKESEKAAPNWARQRDERTPGRVSKKNQIVALFTTGITDIEELARITASHPSYVSSVLQCNELIAGYFDLYTSTAFPMNVYSKWFARQLGFKDPPTAGRGVALLDQQYARFAIHGDRAGQHHALLMALTMFDRARWTGKPREAAIYRDWLVSKLNGGDLREAQVDRTAPDRRTTL